MIKSLKTLYITRAQYVYCIIVLLALILSQFVGFYRNSLEERFRNIQSKAESIRIVITNNGKYQFVKDHHFFGENQNIQGFIKTLAIQDFAEIDDVEEIEGGHIGPIAKNTVKIRGLFWHDSLIFKFLDELQDFKPGFIKMKFVGINKFAKASEEKPVFKVEVVCDVYQR